MTDFWLRCSFLMICVCFALSENDQITIHTHPKSQTVIEGDNVTLQCVVYHVPSNETDAILWTRNRSDVIGRARDVELSNSRYHIAGDESLGEYNLLIVNVSAELHAGSYRCQMWYHLLPPSDPAELTVLVPPKGPFIDGEEKNGIVGVDVVAGRESRIVCRSQNAKPPATLTWYKNGILQDSVDELPPIRNKNGLYSSTAILRLTPSLSDIDATYACVMKNDAMRNGRVGNKLMKLNFINPPMVAIALPNHAKEGMLVKAECRSSSVISDYRWYINDNMQEGETSNVFNLGPTNRTWNRAKIGCEACNPAGCSKRSNAKLNILYTPVFHGLIANKEAEMNDDVTLHCNWDSNPAPLIRWTRKGAEKLLGFGTKMTVKQVDQDDSGMYVCQAIVANVGSNTAEVELIVNGPPVFRNAKTQFVQVEGSGVITCALSSYPGIDSVTWTWFKNGIKHALKNAEMKIDMNSAKHDVKYQGEFERGDMVAKLKINNLDADDMHAYACNASNKYGWEKQSITLEQAEEPATETQESSLDVSLVVGLVIGGVLFLILVVLLAMYVSRSRRATHEFEDNETKQPLSASRRSKMNGNNYEDFRCTTAGNGYHVRTGNTFHTTTPPSTVIGSDDSHPVTVVSGPDDGYSTGENNSWNRKSATPVNDSSEVGSVVYHSGAEKVDLSKPLLSQQSNSFAGGDKPQLHPLSAFQHVQLPYDPTNMVNPATYRCSSTYPASHQSGDGLSSRNYSETRFQPSPNELCAQYRRDPTPILSVADHPHVHFGGAPYIGRVGAASNPASTRDGHRYMEFPTCASQTSMDLPLGASAIETYTNPGRSSNLSRGSQSSDPSRPILISKMATHV